MSEQLQQLIEMSRALGDPREDLVILGEGNTSARADDSSFVMATASALCVEATSVRERLDARRDHTARAVAGGGRAGMNKLLRIMWALVRQQTLYDPAFVHTG